MGLVSHLFLVYKSILGIATSDRNIDLFNKVYNNIFVFIKVRSARSLAVMRY